MSVLRHERLFSDETETGQISKTIGGVRMGELGMTVRTLDIIHFQSGGMVYRRSV